MVEINFLTELADWRDPLKLNRALWKNVIIDALHETPVYLPPDIAVNVLLADNETVHRLNREYRDKDKPTNILSFPQIEDWDDAGPFEASEDEPLELGDLILAWDVIRDEAASQDKSIRDHVAHLLVHGTLHLLGYDHLDEGEAEQMEATETRILAARDIADPYLSDMSDILQP